MKLTNAKEILCPIVVETALKKNNFSITETAKELVIARHELWDYIKEYGLKLYEGEVPPYQVDPQEEIRKACSLAEDLIMLASEYGDFRNGNTHGGVDEGAVLASNALYRIEEKIKEIRNRNNV